LLSCVECSSKGARFYHITPEIDISERRSHADEGAFAGIQVAKVRTLSEAVVKERLFSGLTEPSATGEAIARGEETFT
jgi:hypothetical protein